MKAACYYIYAAFFCLAFFAGMYLFQVFMFARAKTWVRLGVPLSLSQRLLFVLAAFWSHTWFLFVPIVVIGALFFATLLHVLKKA